MKRLLSVLLSLILAMIPFCAASGDNTGTQFGTEVTGKPRMKIGISIPAGMKDRWSIDRNNITDIANISGYYTDTTDTGNQADDIHTMLENGVDLLIIAAENPKAIEHALEEAAKRYVPVIAYDRPIDSPAVTCFISFDSREAGRIQGNFIRDRLDLDSPSDRPHFIEITSGSPDDPNAYEMYSGIMDILRPYFESGKLKTYSGQISFDETATPSWSADKAAARAKEILVKYNSDGQRLDAWMCPNDAVAKSVIDVLSEDYRDHKSVLTTGCDGDADSLRRIRRGTQSMTLYKNLFFETFLTAYISYAISIQVPLDEDLVGLLPVPCIFKPGFELDGKQVDCPTYLLSTVPVTADNLSELLKKNLYTYDKDGYLRVAEDTGTDLTFTGGMDMTSSKVERSGVLDANDYMFRLINQANAVRKITDFKPDIAIVLGSGLGEFADTIDKVAEISYGDLPDFPVSSVSTHAGKFILGTVNGVKVICMNGRVHYYEGYEMSEVVMPIRLMRLLGAKALVLTNSSGGIRDDLNPGDFMLITDHISTHVPSPLRGVNLEMLGTRFQDMTVVYDKELREAAKKAAAEQNIPLKEGVYVQVSGPQYETPTEIKLYKQEGADAVGMSTVCEAIAAQHMGMSICGISFISNKAAGLSDGLLSDDEVVETANSKSKEFTKLFSALIPEIDKQLKKQQ